MFYQLLIITVLSLSVVGCASTHKPIKVMPEKVGSEKKVWVEADTKKIWVNPHVDENGDMVEGHYKHTVMVPGHWVVKEDGKK